MHSCINLIIKVTWSSKETNMLERNQMSIIMNINTTHKRLFFNDDNILYYTTLPLLTNQTTTLINIRPDGGDVRLLLLKYERVKSKVL